MALISSLYPDILPYVPGCPDPMLDQEIRRAAQEYFRRTSAWIAWLADITTVANTRQYTLTLPTDSEVHRIERASIDTSPIEIQIWRQQNPKPDTNTTTNPTLLSEDRTTALLTINPSAGQKLQIQAVLAPTGTATTIPDALWSRHSAAIVEGAKYRLMRTPGPLHKKAEAAEALALFEQAIASMAVETWRSHTSVTPRAKPKWV